MPFNMNHVEDLSPFGRRVLKVLAKRWSNERERRHTNVSVQQEQHTQRPYLAHKAHNRVLNFEDANRGRDANKASPLGAEVGSQPPPVAPAWGRGWRASASAVRLALATGPTVEAALLLADTAMDGQADDHHTQPCSSVAHTEAAQVCDPPGTDNGTKRAPQKAKTGEIQTKLTEAFPKKVKRAEAASSKNPFRKERYTKTIKDWLQAQAAAPPPAPLAPPAPPAAPRRMVQARLVNASGVMKYGRRRHCQPSTAIASAPETQGTDGTRRGTH